MKKAAQKRIRSALLERRRRLEVALAGNGQRRQFHRLMRDVDSALASIEDGTYGTCRNCQEPIETDRLLADPLVNICLSCLTPHQQVALEEDLLLAGRIQHALLPSKKFAADGWDVSYHYEAVGIAGGDYCDLIPTGDGGFYFILGDVSGKGLAASILMSHLHATFRSLVPLSLPLDRLVERAGRAFIESTLPTHFATLVVGKVDEAGTAQICNAGHLPPLWLHGEEVIPIEATGLPVGLFGDAHYAIQSLSLDAGDRIVLYTDGVTEAPDPTGCQYGVPRLSTLLKRNLGAAPSQLIARSLADLRKFQAGASLSDDLSLMVVARKSPA